MKKVKTFFKIFKRSAVAFDDDDGMKLAASLSYSTIFAIAPFLVIVIGLVSTVFGIEAVRGRVFWQIKDLVGKDAAIQIQSIIANVELKDQGVWGTIIGGIILIITATGVFTEIQGSINYMWGIKAKPKKGIVKFIVNRLISFSLVVSIGFILLVSLMLNSLMDLFYDKLQKLFNDTSVAVLYSINLVAIFIVITGLFSVMFKVLPDAKIRWKDSITGAAFTAVLFIIGKFMIGFYIGNSKLGATYGAAASIVVILLWVYYTSIILYFGAEFTKIHSMEIGGGIAPDEQAVYIIKTESKEIPVAKENPPTPIN
ncbi:MAG: YihY/virulence factor BrkB family protein [Sediminibacterium sp.]